MANQSKVAKSFLRMGHIAFGGSLLGYGVGKFLIATFFPHMIGQGINDETKLILYPIWILASLGAVLSTIGWIVEPTAVTHLGGKRNADGYFFHPFVTRFYSIFSALMIVASVIQSIDQINLLIDPPKKIRPGQGIFRDPAEILIVTYCVFCISVFVFYLSTFYIEKQDLVTTTYLSHFWFIFAGIFIPVTWPILVILCVLSEESPKSKSARHSQSVDDST